MRKVVLAIVLAGFGFAVVASAEEAAVKTPAAKTDAPAVKAAACEVRQGHGRHARSVYPGR